MKKLILVLLLVAVNGVAEIPESQLTHGSFNGRWWELAPETIKIGFLAGYSTAVADSALAPSVALIAAQCAQQLLFPKEPTLGDVRKALDRLYAEPENLPLPISSALRVVSMKFRSDKTEDIDAELRRLRILATMETK